MINIYPESSDHKLNSAADFYALQDTDNTSKRQKIYVELENIKQQFTPSDQTYCRKGNTQSLIELYDEALAGDNHKLNILAYQMYHHDKPENKKWLAKIIFKAASKFEEDMIDISSLYQLAHIHIIEKNKDEAISELKFLEEYDFAPATALLGRLYYQGELVEKNDEIAIRMWQSAAERGHLLAYLWEPYSFIKQKTITNKIKGLIWLCIRFVKAIHKFSKMDDSARKLAALV